MRKTKSTRILLAAQLVAASLAAGAATSNYWQAHDENWSGSYSDRNHWSLGHVPASDEDAVIKNTTGKEITINIDVRLGENGVPLPNAVKFGAENMAYSPVRLIGSGRIAQADANFGFAANAIFYITDNVEVEVANSIPSAADRVLVLTENAKLTVGGSFHLGDRGSLTISNGTFKVGSFYAPSSEPCTFRVAGGEVNLGDNKFARFTDDSTIEFTGGNITQETGRLSEPRLFPPAGSEYVTHYENSSAIKMSSAFTNELSGSLFATNQNASATSDRGWFRVEAPNSTSVLYGQGSLSTHILYVNGENQRVVFDIKRVNLAASFMISPSLVFPRDVTIGAFGNYTTTGPDNVNYLGTTTIETTDCFDGVTPRSVTPGAVWPVPGAALRVTGSGMAKFSSSKLADEHPGLRSLEVFDSATAGPTPTASSVLRVGCLALHDNSFASFTAAYSSLDSAAPVVVDQNARVTVSVAGLVAADTTSDGSLVYPVVVAGAGEGVSLDKVTVTGGVTWRAKKVGPAIYLRDDTAKLTSTDGNIWTGAVDGDWNKSDNWQGNAVPGSSSRVFFLVCDTTNVVAIPAAGVELAALCGGGRATDKWCRSSEPYIFRGGRIKLTGTGGSQNAAFFDCGKLPKYFECDVEFSGASSYVTPYKSVSFLGGFTAKTLNLQGGELRFGGTATVTNVQFGARYVPSMRYSMITVLPGGSFTTLNENFTVAANGYFHVLGGGTVTLNGTKFGYTGAPVNTNVVDGTLTINAPYTIDTDQCFVGTGRVDIASTYSGASVAHQEICGGVRLNLGSGFRTVTSANAAGAVAVSVPDFREATLGFKGDVTYGPADGVTPSTTSEERALRIGYRASLTLDTSDPDTGAARTVTFKEPILGGGDLTVTGSGKVVLEATGSRVGRLALSGGTFTYGGEISGWTELLTADSIEGLDDHGDAKLRFRQSPNPDGTVRLLVGENQGLMLILR